MNAFRLNLEHSSNEVCSSKGRHDKGCSAALAYLIIGVRLFVRETHEQPFRFRPNPVVMAGASERLGWVEAV